MKFVKFMIGLLLLVPCVVLSQVLWGLLKAAQPDTAAILPMPAFAMLAGLGLWIALFTIFPRPVRSYILAHELTHALWGLLMGASVSKISVKADRGNVVLSKTNLLITLAPYFFPLYTVIVIAVYYILYLFYDLGHYYLLWLGIVGATWGFHLTFTVCALLQKQSDIQQQGHLLSYTVIYLANIIGICLWVMMVSAADIDDLSRLTATHSKQAGTWITQTADQLTSAVHKHIKNFSYFTDLDLSSSPQ